MAAPTVSSLSLAGFRGVKDRIDLDFTIDGKPACVIISGDNGTGKSSIVDGLEFALLGCLLRGSHRTVAISHLGNAGHCFVTVRLASGEVVSRDALTGLDGRLGRNPHPSYELSPFVLRREDILQFLQAEETKRQLVFTNFFRQGRPEVEFDDKRNSQRVAALRTVGRLSRPIAQAAGVTARDVPQEQLAFTHFVREFLYPKVIPHYADMSEPERRAASKRFRDRHPLGKEVRSYRQALKALRRYRQREQTLLDEYETPEELGNALRDLGDRIGGAFKRISSGSHIANVTLSSGEPTPDSLVLTVELATGARRSPQGFLSEANLDLLALLVFTELVRASADHGQAKMLVLDDVVQSVDAGFRQRFVEHLLEDFQDWQLIFTAHDRLWLEQLRESFRRRGKNYADLEILNWSFQEGPNIRLGGRDPREPIEIALATGDVMTICAIASRSLEALSDRMSWTLPVSMTRRRGDRYTLADHWPAVMKTLRKTSVESEAEAVDRLVAIRNLLGAHQNEWANTLTLVEARDFAESVAALIGRLHCLKCRLWVERQSDRNWRCRCGYMEVVRSTHMTDK